MTVRIYIENKAFAPQIRYVFDTIFFWLGIKYQFIGGLNEICSNTDGIIILYCPNEFVPEQLSCTIGPLIFIKDSAGLFGNSYLKPASVPLTVSRYKIYNTFDESDEPPDIISIYNDGKPLVVHHEKDAKFIQTNLDIVSDIFFMLTRYEEAVSTGTIRKDIHGRFPATESLAYKRKFLHRPIVNEHIELLWSWIEGLSPGCKRWKLWGGNEFAVCLSHDVDHILKNKTLFAALRHTAAVLLKTRKLKKAVGYLKSYFQNLGDYTKDPYWTFNYLVDAEKKYLFHSSFYFMAADTYDGDCRYDIHDIKVKKLIHYLESQGSEAGYHGSLKSYNNKALMNREKRRLDDIIEKKPYGCRQHYLNFQIPETWRNQVQAGLLYDTTLTFAGHEGFRCGICLPFKPFDIFENKVLEIWELPLLIMEGTLQSPEYRNCTPEEGLKNIIRMAETVKKYHGVFTILWHNSSFDYNWAGWETVFESMMGYLGKSDCIGMSGCEMIEYISDMHSE
mgnify:FL=1